MPSAMRPNATARGLNERSAHSLNRKLQPQKTTSAM
jgi:hypothetical protein